MDSLSTEELQALLLQRITEENQKVIEKETLKERKAKAKKESLLKARNAKLEYKRIKEEHAVMKAKLEAMEREATETVSMPVDIPQLRQEVTRGFQYNFD